MSGDARKRCPNCAWAFWHARALKLPVYQRNVLYAVAERADVNQHYHASLDELADDTGIPRRTLQPVVHKLAARGDCIRIERRMDGLHYFLLRPPASEEQATPEPTSRPVRNPTPPSVQALIPAAAIPLFTFEQDKNISHSEVPNPHDAPSPNRTQSADLAPCQSADLALSKVPNPHDAIKTPLKTPLKKESKKESSSLRSLRARTHGACRIDRTWIPSAADRQFACDNGIDADAAGLEFRNFWLNRIGPDSVKFDWSLAFQSRVLVLRDQGRFRLTRYGTQAPDPAKLKGTARVAYIAEMELRAHRAAKARAAEEQSTDRQEIAHG